MNGRDGERGTEFGNSADRQVGNSAILHMSSIGNRQLVIVEEGKAPAEPYYGLINGM